MSLLVTSGTKTFPLASTARNSGSLNWPSPVPTLPHLVMKVPHAIVSIVVVVVVEPVTSVVLVSEGTVVLLDVLVVVVLVGVAGSAPATLAAKASSFEATAVHCPAMRQSPLVSLFVQAAPNAVVHATRQLSAAGIPASAACAWHLSSQASPLPAAFNCRAVHLLAPPVDPSVVSRSAS